MIEVKELVKTYPGGVKALDGVSFRSKLQAKFAAILALTEQAKAQL
jgi:ABC-type phosphate/phosphonate transport system ATPase subunit